MYCRGISDGASVKRLIEVHLKELDECMKIGIEHQANGIDLIKIHHKTVSIVFTNYGARIVSWKIDHNNIVLGNEVEADEFYPNDPYYFGATIGRYAGRIESGSFKLNNHTYEVETNAGGQHLHGGSHGLSSRLFEYETEQHIDHVKVIFTTQLQSSEDNFPGNMDIRIAFTYDMTNTWTIEYYASSTEDTLFNPSNHVYFNLNPDNRTVDNHVLKSDKLHLFPLNDSRLPQNKAIDLIKTLGMNQVPIQALFQTKDPRISPQIQRFKGLDHPFEVAEGKLTLATSHLKLHVVTDRPQIVIYTFNSPEKVGNPKQLFKSHSGIALETQSMPNDIHMFGEKAHSILRGNVPFYSKTSYQVE